ncbi:hypothetical protein, partial [Sansalvadorimonas verongulae]|uniref:hypothetical protein n=1 Tax=Sansalvadorimonas verongulae TaxID=2172824 RepID=UPI001E5465ED
MIFRLNFVVTSLCIVIGLPASVTYTSEDKCRPPHPIPLQPLDMISTGSIAIHPAGYICIHSDETTSCTIKRSAGHHFVHYHGEQQRIQLTLTEHYLALETDTTTWIRNPSDIYCFSSNNEAPDILCTPSPPPSPPLLDTLFPELSALQQQDDVFQSVICASAGECAFDTGGTLTEVSQTQPESDQRPTDISGMNTPGFNVKKYPVRGCDQNGGKPFACDQDG